MPLITNYELRSLRTRWGIANSLLIALLVFAFPVPARAEWKAVATAPDNTQMEVDPKLVVRKGDYVTFLYRSFYAIPGTDGSVGDYTYQTINCRTSQYKIHRTVYFDASAKAVADDRYTEQEGKGFSQPRSAGAAIAKYVCRL